MTPTQGSKMVTLLCLLLATIIATSCGSFEIKTIVEHEVSGQTHVAPEMLDDRKFATLTIHYSDLTQTGLSVKVIGPNETGRKCVLPSSLKPAEPITIRRVSGKTVALTVIDESEQTTQSKLLLVNSENCSHEYAYDGALSRGEKYIFTSNNSSDERFTLIAYNKEFCRGFNWCRLFFDPVYRKFETLDFEFSMFQLESIELATESFDANLFVVRLIDYITPSQSVRLYDLSNIHRGPVFKEMLDLPGIQYEVVSSGLSQCWRASRPSGEPVNCARFRADGTAMLNESFRDIGVMVHVQTVPSGLALFSMKHDCLRTGRCTTVQLALVTFGNGAIQIQRREYRLKCYFTADSLRIRLNEATNSIERVEYMCKDNLNITFRVLYEL